MPLDPTVARLSGASPYRHQLAALTRAFEMTSVDSASWFGRQLRLVESAVLGPLPAEQQRAVGRHALSHHLYTHFYTPGKAVPHRPEPSTHRYRNRREFVSALSAANCGEGSWSAGWELVSWRGDAVTVLRDGLQIAVPSDSPSGLSSSASSPAGPGVGSAVAIRLPKESLYLSPGFYVARSDASFHLAEGEAQVRLYWNLSPAAAPKLLGEVTPALNRAGVPFQLKVLSDPARYDRTDAGVLYLAKSSYGQVQGVLEAAYRSVADQLKPAVPALTRELAPGLGLAEDGGDGTSFGQQRCELLAETMLAASDEGRRSPGERLDFLLGRLETSGIDVQRPYLTPASSDDYGAIATSARRSGGGGRPRPVISRARCLAVATQLGEELVSSAISDAHRATWIGPAVDGASPADGPSSHRSLGPDLYGGTSGIALFLLELSVTTRSSAFADAAKRALRHAMLHLESVAPAHRASFFSGWLGVAYVAIYLGRQLQDPRWLVEGLRLVRRTEEKAELGGEYDYLSGSAGGLLGLALIAALSGERSVLAFGARLAGHVLGGATPSPRGGFSLPAADDPAQAHLTGLSHGASGVALGLVEYFRTTADGDCLRGALAALHYEATLYRSPARNWLDLRGLRRDDRGALDSAPTAGFWCHGAPGIALARLRMWEASQGREFLEDAVTALATTYRLTTDWLASSALNFSLCHGVGGNADVLLSGLTIPELPTEDHVRLIEEIAVYGADRFSAAPWPCGIAATSSPGLMLGTAGIGYLYLRLADPAVPSILLLRPEDVVARLGSE